MSYRIKDFKEINPYAVLLETDATALVYLQHEGPVTRFYRSTDGYVRAEPEVNLPLEVLIAAFLLLGYSLSQIQYAFRNVQAGL